MGALRAGVLGFVVAVIGAQPALADTSRSLTWAGYVAHGPRVGFSGVSAQWLEPAAACVGGKATRSSVWVGLGGAKRNSPALEQVGTEVDCSSSGAVRSGAWYELAPALSHGIEHPVSSGDLISASVTVTGHSVGIALSDLTKGWSYVNQVQAARVDTASAEWIVESPSNCLLRPSCHPYPLTDFGIAMFGSALARSSDGYFGPILDAHWRATRVVLKRRRLRRTQLRPTRLSGAAASAGGAATPGPLLANGTAFAVSYGRAG